VPSGTGEGWGSQSEQSAFWVVGSAVVAAISDFHLMRDRSVTVVTFGSAGSAPW
jgi:hypothetical protein